VRKVATGASIARDAVASPVDVAASAAGLSRTIAGWVPNFCAVAGPGQFRPAVDLAGACHEGGTARLAAGKHGSSVSAFPAAAFDGLVQRQEQGCRPELAARSAAANRQTPFQLFVLRMIFSENRCTLFRVMR